MNSTEPGKAAYSSRRGALVALCPRLLRLGLLGLALLAGGGSGVHAASALERPNWSRQEALSAATGVDALVELKPLYALARAGDDDALLAKLEALETRPGLSAPGREYILQTFAQGLSDLPPRQPSPALKTYLLSYRPRTLVPNQDHPEAGSPLFNVAAAAAGSFNAWERGLAKAQAATLLTGDPQRWIAGWKAADPLRRSGFEDALETLDDAALERVGSLAAAELGATPALAGVVGQIAVRRADPTALVQAIVKGDSVGLAQTLREARGVFDTRERIGILDTAVLEAPPANAALVIAELAPAMLAEPEVERLLFGLLADGELGSAAALVLARSQDPSVRERLRDLAAGGDGLAARRAALAGRLAEETSGRGERP